MPVVSVLTGEKIRALPPLTDARARARVCGPARASRSLSSAPCWLVCIGHSVSLGVSVCSAIVVHSSRGKEFD